MNKTNAIITLLASIFALLSAIFSLLKERPDFFNWLESTTTFFTIVVLLVCLIIIAIFCYYKFFVNARKPQQTENPEAATTKKLRPDFFNLENITNWIVVKKNFFAVLFVLLVCLMGVAVFWYINPGTTVITEAGGNTITPKADGNTITPKADENTVTPKADGNTITPKADGNTVTPKADENTVTPKADENTVTPKADGNTVTPKADRNTVTPVTPETAESYYQRGFDYHTSTNGQQKNNNLAINEFTQAIKLKEANACRDRGGAYFELGKYDEAASEWIKYVGLVPDAEYMYRNIAMSYYDKVTKKDASNLNADFTQAMKYLNMGIELNPESPFNYLYKGLIHERWNNPKEAMEAYRKFLQYVPDYQLAKERLSNLERATKKP